MDDEFKTAAETLAEAMKPSAIQKAIVEMSRSFAKVSNSAIPALSHDQRPSVIPRLPTQEEINEYQSASVLMQVNRPEFLGGCLV